MVVLVWKEAEGKHGGRFGGTGWVLVQSHVLAAAEAAVADSCVPV